MMLNRGRLGGVRILSRPSVEIMTTDQLTAAQKALGFRSLMDVIPLSGDRVRGSHGRLPDSPAHGPVVIGSARALAPGGAAAMTDVYDLILRHLAS